MPFQVVFENEMSIISQENPSNSEKIDLDVSNELKSLDPNILIKAKFNSEDSIKELEVLDPRSRFTKNCNLYRSSVAFYDKERKKTSLVEDDKFEESLIHHEPEFSVTLVNKYTKKLNVDAGIFKLNIKALKRKLFFIFILNFFYLFIFLLFYFIFIFFIYLLLNLFILL